MLVEAALQKLHANGVSVSLAELIRYKGIASRLNLQPASAIRSSMAGTLASRFKGRGMEFDEARHYQPGDDIRSIDWRVTARTGKTHTKLYREERERPVLLYVDLHSSMHFGTQLLYKSVQSMHSAALITFSAQSRGDKMGCVAVNELEHLEIKPKSTAKHVLTMLNQMVNLHNTSEHEGAKQFAAKHTNIALDPSASNLAALTKLSILAKPGTLVYVISDFSNFNNACFDLLGKMQRHCEIRPLQIYDPIELALPSIKSKQHVLLSDGSVEHSLTLGDKRLAEQYSDTREAWFNTLKHKTTQLGMQLRTLNAAQPLEDQLIASRAGLLLGKAV